MKEEFEPNIVAFLCNWCSYAGADLAGTSRLQYPPNVKIIRVMCSGRVNPMFILNAFQEGMDGVIIGGCHPGECHYETGNYFARRRITVLKKILEYVGIDPRRVQMAWISASEGEKFADVMKHATDVIRKLGPLERIIRSNEW
jgi:F420-non-reducing hydrogenase iron-sulfur subunit